MVKAVVPKVNLVGAFTLMVVNHVGLYKAYQQVKKQSAVF